MSQSPKKQPEETPTNDSPETPTDEPIVKPGEPDSDALTNDEIQSNEIQPNKTGEVTNDVDGEKIAQFVTTIRNAEEQVGQHIIQALQHDGTVAVITTVAVGPDGNQQVISAALNPDRMKQVQEILTQAEEERVEEEPCVGFHCLVKPKSA
ncbi:hypothetical protein LF1_35220 [Rubripirellula obstinata]|uniref:Uncharacterized protein n=1 Tax=Rubripirellula obstinata TaxID=406547 RepID=A0A5B1CN27_9BACT|nr:hypothetical protein [Rubripirellula obstinata]KAA1260980.1 hypothetical protein LF1_35220 [Rubripirellula obstinata]